MRLGYTQECLSPEMCALFEMLRNSAAAMRSEIGSQMTAGGATRGSPRLNIAIDGADEQRAQSPEEVPKTTQQPDQDAEQAEPENLPAVPSRSPVSTTMPALKLPQIGGASKLGKLKELLKTGAALFVAGMLPAEIEGSVPPWPMGGLLPQRPPQQCHSHS